MKHLQKSDIMYIWVFNSQEEFGKVFGVKYNIISAHPTNYYSENNSKILKYFSDNIQTGINSMFYFIYADNIMRLVILKIYQVNLFIKSVKTYPISTKSTMTKEEKKQLSR